MLKAFFFCVFFYIFDVCTCSSCIFVKKLDREEEVPVEVECDDGDAVCAAVGECE